MTVVNRLAWMVGGAQGTGVDSAANVFQRAVARGGLHVFGRREYHSNIKGAHSYFQVRVGDRPLLSHVDRLDLLATYDLETVQLHKHAIVAGGGLIYDPRPDPRTIITRKDVGRDDISLFPLPYLELIQKLQKAFEQPDLSRLIIMKNTFAVAASLAVLGYDVSILNTILREIFARKKKRVADMNVKAAEMAYDYIGENFGGDFPFRLESREAEGERMMLQGTHAVGMAKLLAGCRVQTYYPITPASDESEYIEAHPEFGVRVIQTEDEIAAIGMAIGASMAGARAATSTSGPGYSLMAEATGWASMNEQPLVINYYQRGGPSTGLPTRQEQGDLLFTLHASHGEFPRIVLAPGDVRECFYDTIDAFNYADRYQTPVFVLADKHLASTTQSFEYFDTDSVRIDRGMMLSDDELQRLEGPMQANGGGTPFKRYSFTESGISPRSVPGQKGGIFWATGDEHDEYGHISEEGDNRVRMMEKRMRKLETADKEIPLKKKVSVFGPDQADVSLVSWGSTKGAILEALEELGQNSISVNFLQLRMLSPFPSSFVSQFLSKAGRSIDIEQNYSGQLASLIRMKTGIAVDSQMVKFNGRAISRNEVVEGVNEIMKKGTERLVLTYGV